jgi:hypothetical protein
MHLTVKAVRKEAQYIWLTEILDSKSTFRVRMQIGNVAGKLTVPKYVEECQN